MKQYVVKEAYDGNYHVLQYVDGKLESHDIISWHALDVYTKTIEEDGYTRAYFVPEYKKEMLKAKEAYLSSFSEYENAQRHPLVLSDEETLNYRIITHDEDLSDEEVMTSRFHSIVANLKD